MPTVCSIILTCCLVARRLEPGTVNLAAIQCQTPLEQFCLSSGRDDTKHFMPDAGTLYPPESRKNRPETFCHWRIKSIGFASSTLVPHLPSLIQPQTPLASYIEYEQPHFEFSLQQLQQSQTTSVPFILISTSYNPSFQDVNLMLCFNAPTASELGVDQNLVAW